MSQRIGVVSFCGVLVLLLLVGVAGAAERHELEIVVEGPLHELGQGPIVGETRIEVLDVHRVAVAVEKNDALAGADGDVDYYAVFTSRQPLEGIASFWGQATVEFRPDVLLVAPAGESRLYAFAVDQAGVARRSDVAAEFSGADVVAFDRGVSLLYRNASRGMDLGQLGGVAREVSIPLELILHQTEGDGGAGGCARSCSMSCYGGDECSISCGAGACASCSCEDGRLSCICS